MATLRLNSMCIVWSSIAGGVSDGRVVNENVIFDVSHNLMT